MSADDAAIRAFWSWWEGARDAFAAGIESGGVDDPLIDALRERVEALAPGLDWELSRGEHAAHALVVTPGGNPDVRAIAHRWLRAAPPADETWEYHAARRPEPRAVDNELELDGRRVALGETVVATEVDERRAEVDVTVHHPLFGDLDERAAGQIAFLVLDWLLGEEEVERWIGAVDLASERPEGARPAAELLGVVERLATLRPPDHGALLEGRGDDGLPLLASTNGSLKPVDHPLLDTRVTVTVAFDARDDGLPERGVLEELRRLEDDLVSAAGDGAFLAAHVTHAGRRAFELYADGTTGAADRAREWASANRAEVEVEHDPAWDGVRNLR